MTSTDAGREGVRRVVINACYGGFSLSPAAVRRIAEMDGRPCYFFVRDLKGGPIGSGFEPWRSASEQEAAEAFMYYALDVPTPDLLNRDSPWHEMTEEEREAQNAEYNAHVLAERDIARDDARLVAVVEELGGEKWPGASGACAELRIVEIPADAEWEIDEYDGIEHIAEKHRTWR